MATQETRGATESRPKDLLRDLHGFLSLEAPFLLPNLQELMGGADLERNLLSRLKQRVRSDAQYPAEELYPGVNFGKAVGWVEQRLTEQIRGFFARRRYREALSDADRLLLLETMLMTRAVDNLLKQAFDSKEIEWQGFPSPQKGFRSRGQEAIVGAALPLRRGADYGAGGAAGSYRGDYICPLIRDLGALLMFMPDPLHPLLVQYGKVGTIVGGRDLHVGDLAHGVLPPAAPLAIGPQTLVGVAHALQARNEDRICVSFIGDGGSSLGEWHEAINLAAVKKLGMVFVIQNNHWALGTHVSEQSAVERFANKAAGYGLPGVTLFGNDPEEVAGGMAWAAERARFGEGPTLLELVSYRHAGHAHHDDDRFHGNPEVGVSGYELVEERESWERLDPIDRYQSRLLEAGVLSDSTLAELRSGIAERVTAAVAAAAEAPWPEPSSYRERVFAPREEPLAPISPAAQPKLRKLSYDEAVRTALIEMMEEDPEVFVLGEDVGGRYGGAFGVTRGLAKRFGDRRCMNTPLAESSIVGCGVGAALMGMRPVVEMQFADFLAPGFNALVNNAAKVHWRWGGQVPLVVRLPYGGATGTMNRLLGGGPFHSQCPEMWFLRTPGWKIVAPSTPADAKGLMVAALRDPNPVLYLEAKGLYGFFREDLREEVPLGTEFEVPIGTAAIRRAGTQITLLTYGAMVWTALEAAERAEGEGLSIEVVDLRSLCPLDRETISTSVSKTHRVLILHEDTRTGGLAGELTAILCEGLFYQLDAPVRRVTAPDTPVPYSPPLEYDFLPKVEDVMQAARELAAE